jgi:peptidoglycan/LPS O-acetylase OafA/YrhL
VAFTLAGHRDLSCSIEPAVLSEVAMRRAPLGYVPSLDGLRAVSILLVMGDHNMGPVSQRIAMRFAGWSGVDMFFVISGFLITSLLTDERDRYGTFSLRNFYLRRVLRIAPAYLAFLTVMTLWRGQASLATCAISLVYLIDYAAALQWPFFDRTFGIAWSLSVEEQFYLLWPLALWIAPRRSLLLCIILICAVIAWRAVVVWDGATWERIYFAFDTRVDSIMIGCAAALVRRRPESTKWLARLGRAPWACALALAASAATLHYYGMHRGVLAWCIRLPFHDALVAVFVLVLVQAPTSLPGRALGSPVMAFIGRLSYSMYLWHQFAFSRVSLIAHSLRLDLASGSLPVQVATEAARLLLTIAMAAFSFFAVERPFLRLKGRLHRSHSMRTWWGEASRGRPLS